MIRQFRILWGPTLENVLDFAWPVVGDAPRVWRQLREGSEILAAAAATDVSITGRDYYLAVTAKWFDLSRATGATGLQAFIDWANVGNAFTLIPDTALQTLTVPGCFLVEPFADPSWSVEQGGEMTVDLVIRHPTQDIGLAWRGLFYEYVAGQSLSDPVVHTFTRGNAAYELGPDGYLRQTTDPADGHYPGFVDGLQTLMLHAAATNDIADPEALNAGSWSTSFTSVTANNAKAPDQNLTADLVKEDATTNFHALFHSTAWAIAANDVLTGMAFVRAAGRYQASIWFADAANPNTNRSGVQFDLVAGTASAYVIGTGSNVAVKIVPLAGGWYMLWWRCAVGNGSTSVNLAMALSNNGTAGGNSYAGDNVSGMYLWGVTGVHGAANGLSRYVPTSTATDNLSNSTVLARVVPQASWFYLKLVEAGALFAPGASFPSPLTLGNFGSPNWRTIFYASGGQYQFANGNSVSQVIKATTSAPAFGQVVELLGQVFADGSVRLLWSVAGGAENATTQSAAPATAVPATYGTNVIALGDAGGYGTDEHCIAVARFGPGAMNTIAAARDA